MVDASKIQDLLFNPTDEPEIRSFFIDFFDPPMHIMPLHDYREHETSKECWCNPTVDEDENLVTHNSLDGREYAEYQ